jgi:hypothetical protein
MIVRQGAMRWAAKLNPQAPIKSPACAGLKGAACKTGCL